MGDYIRGGGRVGLYQAGPHTGLGNYGEGVGGLVDFDTGLDPGEVGGALKEATEKGSSIASKYFDQIKGYYNNLRAMNYSKSDAEMAQYFMMQGADVLDRGANIGASIGLVSSETAQKISGAMTATRDAVKAGFSLGSGEGGSLDKIKDVDTLIKSTLTIANAMGANAETTQLIQQWASVGTGCATMIMGAGPVWGTIGCAASTLLTALSMRAPGPITSPEGVPLASLVFSPNLYTDYRPEITQSTIVARDAMLLAQVLKHHYGLQTTTPLYEALSWSSNMPFVDEAPPFNDVDVWGRTVDVFRKYHNFLGKGIAKPAVDLHSMLLAVTALDRTEPTSWRQTGVDLNEIALRVCDHGDWDEACHCVWDKDGNGNCGGTLRPSHEDLLAGRFYVGAGQLNQAGIATGASIGRGRIANNLPVGSLLKFIRVDELINFFHAVSLNTRRQDAASWELELIRFLLPELPVQFWYMKDSSKKNLWSYTNIMCSPGACGSPKEVYVNTGDSAADALRWRVFQDGSGHGDVEAQREYAALRLMAAMSYLIWMERQDYSAQASYMKQRADMIGTSEQNAPLSVAWQAQMPIDPRQVVQKAPGVYVANTFGDRHPWDVGQGAEIKTYAPMQVDVANPAVETAWAGFFVSEQQSGVKSSSYDYSAGVHFGSAYRSHSTRDGWWLHLWIMKREAYYRDLIADAHRAALAATSGQQLLLNQGMLLTPQTSLITAGGVTAKMWATLAEKGMSPQLLSVSKAEFKANCEKGGGYVDTEGNCRPSAATEAACRAQGGTPYWDPVNLYKCLAPGEAPPNAGGGGGAGGVVLLAGAALLLMKFLK